VGKRGIGVTTGTFSEKDSDVSAWYNILRLKNLVLVNVYKWCSRL
jgi:hypothetical protein